MSKRINIMSGRELVWGLTVPEQSEGERERGREIRITPAEFGEACLYESYGPKEGFLSMLSYTNTFAVVIQDNQIPTIPPAQRVYQNDSVFGPHSA